MNPVGGDQSSQKQFRMELVLVELEDNNLGGKRFGVNSLRGKQFMGESRVKHSRRKTVSA